jgi:hypothetical protein
MGTVYKAVDRKTGATVAVKILHPHLAGEPAFLERFRREAYIASLLSSPHVVRVLDSGSEGDHQYIVYEYVEGVKLGELVQAGRLDPLQALAIAIQVARALEEADRKDVVHRDIKPDNIIFTPDGLVKVTDFGIGRLMTVTRVTVTGQFLGTVSYTAPEQARGRSDIRADIYSLGVTLFEMLAGELPFKSETPTNLMRMHEEAPPPLEKLTDVPEPIIDLIARCLEKDPDKRFQGPAELVDAIEATRRSLDEPATVTATWVADVTQELAATRVGLAMTRMAGAAGGGEPPRRGWLPVALGGFWGGNRPLPVVLGIAAGVIAVLGITVGGALALSGGGSSNDDLVIKTDTPTPRPTKSTSPTVTTSVSSSANPDPSPGPGPGSITPTPCPDPQGCGPNPPKDTDRDGVLDANDNCPSVANGNQANFDGDGQGDACDADDDNDGMNDGPDQCDNTPPGTAIDGNGCTRPGDDDGDLVPNTGDNCPTIANGNQANFDGDSQGDACDGDDDNDGVGDDPDQCDSSPPATPVTSNGCPPTPRPLGIREGGWKAQVSKTADDGCPFTSPAESTIYYSTFEKVQGDDYIAAGEEFKFSWWDANADQWKYVSDQILSWPTVDFQLTLTNSRGTGYIDITFTFQSETSGSYSHKEHYTKDASGGVIHCHLDYSGTATAY